MGGGADTSTLTEMLSVVSSFFTNIGSLAATIAGSALLLIPIASRFVGSTIGHTKSLMGTRSRRRG